MTPRTKHHAHYVLATLIIVWLTMASAVAAAEIPWAPRDIITSNAPDIDAGPRTDVDDDLYGPPFVLGVRYIPVADAGSDQNVYPNATVTLDGSASIDPDNFFLPLIYRWTQAGGPAITLSDADAVTPTFTAPGAATVLTFTLVVTSDLGLSDPTPDMVVITVIDANLAPVADAGNDRNVRPDTTVTLNGSASNDPDGNTPLTYHWSQTGGPAATLSNATAVTPTFTAPPSATVLTFTLTVTDSLGLPDPTPDMVVITVIDANLAPVADAGNDRNVRPDTAVMLDGSASTDPDGNTPLTYHWSQTGGPAATLSNATAVTPTFTAPPSATVLTFTLTVTDSLGLPDPTPDMVVITVDLHRVYLPLALR